MSTDNRPRVTITNEGGVYRYRVQCGEMVFDGNAETMAIHLAFAFEEIARRDQQYVALLARVLGEPKQETFP